MFERTALPSGPRVISARLPGARSVSIAAYVLAGSRLETPAEAGVAHFMEHITFKGTARFPSTRAISEAIEGVGGSFNAATDRESTVYWVRVPRREATRAMDVLGELIVRPRLADDEIEGERAVIVEEIRSYLDDPAEYAQILFQQAMFGDGPLGREICGDETGIRALPAATIRDFWRTMYRPANTVVALAGDVGHEEALALADDAFGTGNGKIPGFSAAPTLPAGKRFLFGARRDASQAQLVLGVPGLRRDHPDAWALSVLNAVLGDGMSSRLFLSVREELGLAYDVSSGLVDYADAGAFEISAGVDPDRLPAALEAILVELVKLRDEPVPAGGARQGQGVPVRWPGASDGRDAPSRIVDRRPGGASRQGPYAGGGTRRGRRRRRDRGRAAGRRAIPRRGPQAGRRRPSPLRPWPRAPPAPARMTIVEEQVNQDSDERAADLVLARLHLRLGSLGLARAELESMAGRNSLDDQGIRDLAEVRWRTGDLAGAGDAAAAYLEGEPEDVLALVIAAEMQSHLGRPGEARRLASRALDASEGLLDAIFAGMPRGAIWPVDTGGPLEPAGTLFADLGALPPDWSVDASDSEADATSPDSGAEPGVALALSDQVGPGLWDADHVTVAPALPDPAELFARARAALEANRPGQAAAGLALAIRAAPSLGAGRARSDRRPIGAGPCARPRRRPSDRRPRGRGAA